MDFGAKTKNIEEFSSALKRAVGKNGADKNLEPRVSLDVRDFDSFAFKTELKEAIERDLGTQTGNIKVSLSRPNSREHKIAIVCLSEPGLFKTVK